MSMIKRAWLSGKREGESSVQVVRPGEMVKTASHTVPEIEDFISKLRPDPKYTYVLVNAMGYSEFFGANSNKDYYGHNPHINFNGLLHAPADWGADPCKDMAAGKKWLFGYPCFYGASVYAHHKNSCPKTLGFGDVIFVMPNHRMKRIELVMRVDNEKAAERGRTALVDRIRAGERVDVSMGTKVPFDTCSVCTDWETINRAMDTFDAGRHLHPGLAVLDYHRRVSPIRGLSITRSDYCSDMRLRPGQILPDGKKIFVFNDHPRFFDISFVWIGADKTARVMWHLGAKADAPAAMPTFDASPFAKVAQRRNTVRTAMEKTAQGVIFFKRGEIEKEIPAGFAKKIDLCARHEPDLPFDVLRGATDQFGAKPLLSTLASLGIVLKPREFHIVVTKGRPLSEKLASLAIIKGAEFDTSSSEIDDSYAVGSGNVSPALAKIFAPAADSRSSFAPHLGPRVTGASMASLSKESSYLHSDLMNEVAAQYNGYRLSVLEQAPEVFPKYAGLLGGSLAKGLATAGASGIPGMAPLLLGLGPVIHLVSAHLRKKEQAGEELGTMAKFVAENPTFASMATIGAGLRAMIGIQAAGGLGAAVKGVVSALRVVV